MRPSSPCSPADISWLYSVEKVHRFNRLHNMSIDCIARGPLPHLTHLVLHAASQDVLWSLASNMFGAGPGAASGAGEGCRGTEGKVAHNLSCPTKLIKAVLHQVLDR